MKKLFLSLSILLVGSFAVANQNSNNTKVNEYEYYTINDDMSVTYCVSAGGNYFVVKRLHILKHSLVLEVWQDRLLNHKDNYM